MYNIIKVLVLCATSYECNGDLHVPEKLKECVGGQIDLWHEMGNIYWVYLLPETVRPAFLGRKIGVTIEFSAFVFITGVCFTLLTQTELYMLLSSS